MKVNIVDQAEVNAVSARNGSRMRPNWPALLLLLVFVAIGAGGCTGYYSDYPGYYGRPYYGGPYGPGYAGYPGYASYPGSVTIEIGDRPYYTRGPGYYVGRAYYVWRPGHWAWRNGRRVWIHGHYARR
jgi:hypothetical protein